MGRITACVYGVACYLLFLATFLYSIGFVSGLGVPKTIDSGPLAPTGEALITNLALLGLFAVQHSLMARPEFKTWWTRFVPASVERSTYVLFSNLALIVLFWLWRPMPAAVWDIQNSTAALALMGLSLTGWLIVLTSTFLLDHFELFGVHQVFRNFTGEPMPAAEFRTPLYYKRVRHPIYLGFVVAFWATPTMSVGHLCFAAATTLYVVLAIGLEERDLIAMFGDDYRDYRGRVPMLIPWR